VGIRVTFAYRTARGDERAPDAITAVMIRRMQGRERDWLLTLPMDGEQGRSSV